MVGGRRGWPGDSRSPLTSPASGSWTLLQPPSQRVGSSIPGRATPGPESPPSPPRVLPSEPRPRSATGVRGGAPHSLPGPRRRDRGHQGHLHPPEDPQVSPWVPSAECGGVLSSPLGAFKGEELLYFLCLYSSLWLLPLLQKALTRLWSCPCCLSLDYFFFLY